MVIPAHPDRGYGESVRSEPEAMRLNYQGHGFGNRNFFNAMNVDLDRELTPLGIPHVFEKYEGGHGNRAASRFQNSLLTLFSAA